MTEIDRVAERVETSGRTLRRAVAEGLVRGHRLGPRRILLRPGEEEYLLRHWQIIGQLRQLLRTEPSVDGAVLFGSMARGDDRPTSDVDLFVRFREGWTLDTLYGLEERLSRGLGRQVEVAVYDEQTTPAIFLQQLLEEGRPVVDRVGFWTQLVRRRREIERAAEAFQRDREATLGL